MPDTPMLLAAAAANTTVTPTSLKPAKGVSPFANERSCATMKRWLSQERPARESSDESKIRKGQVGTFYLIDIIIIESTGLTPLAF